MSAGAAVLVGPALVVALGLALVGWLVRSRMRERRKAHYFAELSARYRKPTRALPSGRATDAAVNNSTSEVAGARSQMVTVEELVARIAGEGLPVRLR